MSLIPLTSAMVKLSVDEICADASLKLPGFTFRRANMQAASCDATSPSLSTELSLIYGFTADCEGSDSGALDCRMHVSFQLAYSTWEGRVLHIDQLCQPSATMGSRNAHLGNAAMLTLAKIAVKVGCRRLTWRHRGCLQRADSPTSPETLDGWLTLCWDAERMQAFSNNQTIATTRASCTRETIKTTLAGQRHGEFCLRLAEVDDLPAVHRLIHGLAEYEKEPDAVNVSLDQLRIDGFSGEPLFYCLIVDNCTNSSSDAPYTGGMALCYLGEEYGTGRFLYLEDLFFEESFRGKGGGTLVMRALADVGRALGCARLFWQALDWNTPALKFYKKIGAEVQHGLLTSRYAGKSMQDFAAMDYNSCKINELEVGMARLPE